MKPQTVEAELGVDDVVVGERVNGCTEFRGVLCCSGEVSTVIWDGDMGYVSAHWEDLGRLPPQGGPQTYGRKPWRGMDGTWLYPPVVEAMAEVMAEAGLPEVETYVACRHNTYAQYIVVGPIMDLCLKAE